MKGTVIRIVVIVVHILLFILLYSLSGSDDAGEETTNPATGNDKPDTSVSTPASGNTRRPASGVIDPISPRPSNGTATTAFKHHVVKSGDNLSVIAKKYNTTVAKLKEWNKLNAKGTIFPNQKLVVSE